MEVDATWVTHKKIHITEVAAVAARHDATTVLRAYLNTLVAASATPDLTTKLWTTLKP